MMEADDIGRLDGRVAILTGVAKYLGQADTRRLGEEGARLSICDIADCSETVVTVQGLGAEVLLMQVDVSDEAQAQHMALQVIERYGRIYALLNNTALFNGLHITKMEDVDMAEWDCTYAVNTKGTFLCCRAVVPHMKQAGDGKKYKKCHLNLDER